MNQFKRAQVIMLPTKDKSLIYNCEGKLLYDNKIIKSIPIWKDSHQHLYIISDDEIKKCDWFLNTKTKAIGQHNGSKILLFKDDKKIIATTDTSLEIMLPHDVLIGSQLPQLSQQFIEKYIESYNKGEIITDVLVEYRFLGGTGSGWTPKINPKDNTITIKKLKDNWNREEIVELLHKLNNDSYKYLNYKDLQKIRLTKWIEENL